MRLLLQHKIFIGYFLLMAVIGCMVAIVLHERKRVSELMDEQQSINKKIANQIPVIVQKSVQEQSKKPKRKGFLGIFGKKKEVTPAVSTIL